MDFSLWESELQSVCAFIGAHPQYARIALQFPDALLPAAPEITYRLQSAVVGRDNGRVFILGDTAYSPCCVDEVAAEHLTADLVLHFGPVACMTATSRLPVYHLFGAHPLDADAVADGVVRGLGEAVSAPVLLLCEFQYMHCADLLAAALRPSLPGLVVASVEPQYTPTAAAEPADEEKACSTTGCSTTGWRYQLGETPIGEWNIVFVGPQSAAQANFMLTKQAKAFWRWDVGVGSWQQENPSTHSILMQRYHMIERAKRVGFFGILVGTLGAGQYLQIIERLKRLIGSAGRKSKLILVGKLNVAKLANFAEVGAFVLVGCPLSTLVDSKEYSVPIITPFELEVALGGGAVCWDGNYETDFTQLLAGELGSQPVAEIDAPLLSKFSDKTGLLEIGAEAPRGDDAGVLMKASEAPGGLLSRSFQGLLVGLSEHPPAVIERGQYGIAKGYTTEESNPFDESCGSASCCRAENPATKCASSANDAATDSAVQSQPSQPTSTQSEPPAAADDEEEQEIDADAPQVVQPIAVQPVAVEPVAVEDSSDSSDCEMSLDAFAELEDCLDNL